MDVSTKLTRDFYLQPTLTVARQLIGKEFVLKRGRMTLSGKIVETEAYIGQSDPACHAAVGRTGRNAVMFGAGGYTYVYFVYGMYNMLNFVTEPEGQPAAVLIRAMEPQQGIKRMQKRRKRMGLLELTSGPGKLCQAFGIEVKDSGRDLTTGNWFVFDNSEKVARIARSARIGIRAGSDRLWRFYDPTSEFVSR